MLVNDSELRRLAFDFVGACFLYLRATWSLPNVPGRYLLVGRDYSYFGISDLLEYQALFTYLAQDARIRKIYERRSGGLNDNTLNKYLIRLFERVLRNSSGEFSPEVFERWFSTFRDEVFKQETTLKRIWFLGDFECTKREIVEITDALKIRHFEHWAVRQSLEKDADPCSYWVLSSLFGHALLLTEIVEKKDIPYVMNSRTVFRKLSSVVTAFRLFKSGFVDVSYSLYLEVSDFPLDNPLVLERNVMGDPFSDKYVLQDSELEPFIRFWKELYDYLFRDNVEQTRTMNRLRLAINYFESSYRKPWDEALVDLAISLEALLLEGGSKAKKNLQNRVSTLIATDPKTSAKIKGDIGIMYNLRSQVVHGSAMSRSEFHKQIAELSGIAAHEFTFDDGRLAVEKVRGYVREVIRSLINRTLHEEVELGKRFFSTLDRQKDLRNQMERYDCY